MAVITPAAPGFGITPTYTTVTASDTIPVGGSGRYLLITRNTSGTSMVSTIDDPNTIAPPGSAAVQGTFADVVITTPITTGERHTLFEASRHRDAATGLITMTTGTPTAGMTATVVGPF